MTPSTKLYSRPKPSRLQRLQPHTSPAYLTTLGERQTETRVVELTLGVKDRTIIASGVLVVKDLSHEAILGMDVLGEHSDICIRQGKGTVLIQGLPPIRVIPFDKNSNQIISPPQ